MKSEKSEDCHATEYVLRQDLHSRDGEIIRLECQNGMQSRRIVTLNGIVGRLSHEVGDMQGVIDEHLKKEARLEYRIGDLGEELNVRNILRMKESLKAFAQLALRQDDEITNLKSRVKGLTFELSSRFLTETAPEKVSDEDLHKIAIMDEILHTFNIETIAKYEELVVSADIDIACVDYR